MNPLQPYGNFITSDPKGLPIDRRPLPLGLYLKNQSFSPNHNIRGNQLLTSFKNFRGIGWAGNALGAFGLTMIVLPELMDASLTVCKTGIYSGIPTIFGGIGCKVFSKIKIEEVTAELETEFHNLKTCIISHNKKNPEEETAVPYLADPSISERLVQSQIDQNNSNTAGNMSNIPSNIATAGILVEFLKGLKYFRKN